ncbi:MAG: AAA family ATPase [Burkholderiaceae bacterium]|nr:AAA family ATPase [Burkholderiaceae bacterium]
MQINSQFTLFEELYSSASTRIWRAAAVADGRPVVLKILSEDEAQHQPHYAQFQREFQIMRTLQEVEGVNRAYALENVNDALMIVSEDIGGRSLAQVLEGGPLAPAAGLPLAVRLADMLAGVHAQGVIHKDLTPANIVWNRATGALRLIDFGIASQLNQERSAFQSVHELEGTLHYVSPEQTGRVNRGIDSRSDLYTLGVTLYHLFTGVLPFAGRHGIELVHAHIALAPKPPHLCNPAVPPLLSDIILRLMAKNADDRYQSAAGLAHDLRLCAEAVLDAGGPAAAAVGFTLGAHDALGNFRIPGKLYGRAREIAAIVAAFERAASGPAELLLVGGCAGSGKTALVHEVHQPLTQRHGGYIEGKFDQYQRDVPFYAWRMAFEGFCQLLLKEDEASLARWRERILGAVDGQGKVLAEVIPSIELVIGPQPAVLTLSGGQALNRLHYVFGAFLQAVCSARHPLAVFIDDWQWADAGSLSLLEAVMAQPRLQSLLLICAYRDNETPAAHPFAQALARLRAAHVPLDAIEVQALTRADVRQMVSDTLAASPHCEALADLLFERTDGNAFFLRQLLTELHGSGALRYDLAQRQWRWRDEDIAALAIADNVVSLMGAKIARLPGPVRQALLYASCIGDRFELATLAALLGQPPHEVAAELEQALQAGIVAPVGMNYRTARQEGHTDGVHYRFIHDRVRQAAYGMLGEDTRARLHHLIARQWLDSWSEAQRRQRIFDIANQFNAGRALVQDAAERGELAQVNLEAGKRARAAAAYSSAQAYFRLAIESAPTAIWEQQPALAMELYLAAAETAFLAKDYPAMDQWVAEFLAHRSAPVERVQALKIQVQACVAQNRLSDAVDIALHALALLGVPLQRTPHPLRVMAQLVATKLALRNRPISELQQLPAMEDPAMLAVMDLLGLILPPAYWISEGLLALVVCKMVSVSLAHGYSPNAGYGFVWWGITECAMLGNIETGVAYGEFANDLARRHHLNLQQPLFFAAWIIHKFRHPLRSTIPMFEETYALSLQKGDFEYASYARNNQMQTLFHTGCPLPELLDRMAQAHADLQRFQVGSSLYWHAIWWQAARNFATHGEAPTVLNGDAYRESELLPQHQKANDASSLFLLYSAKLMLAIHFNDGAHALSHARSARQYLKAGVGMHAFVLFHFHESLALLLHSGALGWAAQRRVSRVVDDNLRKLKLWAQHAPDNYRYHWLLCEALRLRLRGRMEQAGRLLDDAIDCARAQGQLHEEALACELAARSFLAQQRERLAGHYLRQALLMYERWGAEAKLQQLSGEFAGLLATSTLHGDHTLPTGGRTVTLRTARTLGTLGTGAMAQHAFDMQAVTSASQAISKEIRIADMVRTLLSIVVEHSGAQRALLMLRQGDSWRVVASADAGAAAGIEVGTCDVQLDNDAQGLLPVSLAQYVRRTMRPQVLQDARQQSIFSGDPYLQRARPRSVLCEPIAHQGSLLGILYLENTLTVGAFPEERLELLRVLAAQAAISLENARLYADMEARVRARTRELAESLETVRVTGEQVAALLDNAGQGFLSFGADMAVAPQYSRACETMLGLAPAGRHAGVLLFPGDPHNADLLADATQRVLGTDDPDRREVMLSLLPSEWTRAGRQLSATYAVLNTGRMMVTLTDVTEERRLAEQVAAEHGRLQMVHAAVAESTEFLDSVAAFRQFVREELPHMLAAQQPPQAVLERVYREVHTYKGVLGQFCFQHAPQVLHVAESGLEDLKDLGDRLTLPALADYLASLGLEQAIAGDLAALESVLGPAFLAGGKRLSVTDQQARQMESLVMQLLRGEPVEMAQDGKRDLLVIGNLHKVAVRDALSSHDRTMAAVATRLRKLLAPLRFIDSETVWLDPAACRPFLRSLAHVFRNAVAHGIEAPPQRRAAGKPDAGQITCSIVRSDGWLTLEIADDGGGIDTAALRRKARERGLYGDAELAAMDEAVVQDLVFADGLSTAARADQFSGRGVGLAAVRAETLKLGGTVSVRSVPGQGTRFTFRLPLAALAATVESEVL